MLIGTKTVEDPYGGPGDMLRVDHHRGEDVIEGLVARGQLTPGRYQVAVRFRALHERSSIGTIGAIDYRKPMVSGGIAGDVFTDQLLAAGQEMRRVSQAIGQTATSFLSQIVVVGSSIGRVAQRYADAYDLPPREARAFVRGRLCEALDELGAHWGMTEARRPDRRPRIKASGQTPVATDSINRDDAIIIRDMRED